MRNLFNEYGMMILTMIMSGAFIGFIIAIIDLLSV